jgi:SAM-dependent methyltransferase
VQDPPRDHQPQSVRVERRPVDEPDSLRANRADWDRYADEYQATHGEFLGDAGFLWGPEGVREDDLHALGDVTGRRVLELGCGAGQCSRWVLAHGGTPVGLDVSMRQLQHSRRIDDDTGIRVPSVLGTATELPFADDSFDVVFSSFGALQFVSDIGAAVAETARVLRPGGRYAFSITHPTRWMFPDDPGEAGLVASQSYWDRTPYVEVDDASGRVAYVEHHRTLGDWVALLAGAGFVITDLLEPEWPEGHDRVWGGWGPERGALIPGTAIFGADLRRCPGRSPPPGATTGHPYRLLQDFAPRSATTGHGDPLSWPGTPRGAPLARRPS